jgi:homoserine dehydrogenase
MEKALHVGIVGFGNIGTGVVRSLDGLTPVPIRVTRIADKDTTTTRNAPYAPSILSDDVEGLLADPDIDVVLELTGTIDFARGLIEKAIRAGKHVVTANKALLAVHGADLFRLAEEKGVCILFEAAVGGGIPLIRTLHLGLSANRFQAVRGIINGTANYILTRMSEDGMDFGDALAEAQKLGYAEPDPTYDIEGHDTAHKLAVLATLCFGQDLRFADVYREGITRISALDIAYTQEMGYAIKLLGIAKRDEEGRVSLRVHPALVETSAQIASINGVFNAVLLDGNLTGPVLLSGRGAGPDPTSSAILSDMMALASGKKDGGLAREMRLCAPKEPKNLLPMDDIETRYYIRLGLADRAGSLAQVLTVFGKEGVSVESMHQPPECECGEDCGSAHVLIVTHTAREAQVRRALEAVQKLEVNCTEPFLLRIEEM